MTRLRVFCLNTPTCLSGGLWTWAAGRVRGSAQKLENGSGGLGPWLVTGGQSPEPVAVTEPPVVSTVGQGLGAKGLARRWVHARPAAGRVCPPPDWPRGCRDVRPASRVAGPPSEPQPSERLPPSSPHPRLLSLKLNLASCIIPALVGTAAEFPGSVSERLGVSVTCTQSVVTAEFALLPPGRADSPSDPELTTSRPPGCLGDPGSEAVGVLPASWDRATLVTALFGGSEERRELRASRCVISWRATATDKVRTPQGPV